MREDCVHLDACKRLLRILGEDVDPRCQSCKEYDDTHCPLSFAGTMRCSGLSDVFPTTRLRGSDDDRDR